MRQYIYKPSDLGLRDWPSGTLRLEGIDVTENPAEADLFTVPGMLTTHFPDTPSLYRLPYLRGNEERHVLFDCSDHDPVYKLPCLFIRCNTRTWYLKDDPNTISWPWPVEDFKDCIELPQGGFKYDVSFQGWNWSNARKQSVASCLHSALKCDIATYSDFCGYIYDTPEGIRRRAEFRRSMKESRIALCPESIPGVFPYRFFEAMSAARVPLLVGKTYVLPQADVIPYDNFTIRIEDPAFAATAIERYLDCTGDALLVERGCEARYYWEKYLRRDKWPRLMAEAVQRKLMVAA